MASQPPAFCGLGNLCSNGVLYLMLFDFILHEVSMQALGIYQYLTKLILCPLLLKRKFCTCHPISCICSGACLLYFGLFQTPLLSPALTNTMKKGEMTGIREKGEGEDNLGAKELGLIVFGCSRQTEWLCCDIQLYPVAPADTTSAFNCVTSMCPNSVFCSLNFY